MVKGLRFSRAIFIAALSGVVLFGCLPQDYSRLPALSRNHHFQAVIEVPAGSNLKVKYCRLTHRFRAEGDETAGTTVPYLASPANFGFIPSTEVSVAEDRGKLLGVMVLSERMETGKVLEIIPLGLIVIKDDFQTDYKVLAIPAEEDKRTVDVRTFRELQETYPELTQMLETWLLNSRYYKNAVILGWEDEYVTVSFIEKWMVN